MAGYIIPIAAKMVLDFSTLEVGGAQDVVVLDRVDLLHWREVTLRTRVHSNQLTAGSVQLVVIAESWTPEEPSQIFLGNQFWQSPISGAMGAPLLISTALPMRGSQQMACMTAMARVVAHATRSIAGPLAMQVSLEFSVKDA